MVVCDLVGSGLRQPRCSLPQLRPGRQQTPRQLHSGRGLRITSRIREQVAAVAMEVSVVVVVIGAASAVVVVFEALVVAVVVLLSPTVVVVLVVVAVA